MKLTHKKFLITSLPFTAASVSVPLILRAGSASIITLTPLRSVQLFSVQSSGCLTFSGLRPPALPRSHWAAATGRRNYAHFCAAAFLPAA